MLLPLLATASLASAAAPPLLAPNEIRPSPAVVEYAAKNGIAIEGIAFAPEGSKTQPGDEITYVLAVQQPAGQRQWLVRIIAAETPDTAAIPDDTIYTSTGLELRYTHQPAALDIEFIGPFEPGAVNRAQVTSSRARNIVSAEALQEGLIRYCESSVDITRRLRAAGIEQPVYHGMGSRPKPGEIEAGRKAAAAFGLTAEEERIAFSVFFALRAFYQAASEIPGCRDALEQVVQKPSLWSVASSLGVNSGFLYGWQAVLPLPPEHSPVSLPTHVLPVRLTLNNQPALISGLAVTDTRPPLRNGAGIVALFAEHPKDPSKRAYLRLLSARPAKR